MSGANNASELSALQSEIDACAKKVVDLKSSGAEASAVKEGVAALLSAKTKYAALNGGKLADGTPFDPNASKKDKKKKKKAAGPAAGDASNAPTAENAAKKAAKKAEQKAKRDAAKKAAKEGGPAAAQVANAVPKNVNFVKKNVSSSQQGKVEPLQLCFSPNPGAKVSSRQSEKLSFCRDFKSRFLFPSFFSRVLLLLVLLLLLLPTSQHSSLPFPSQLPFVTVVAACLLRIDCDLKFKMDIYRPAAPALGTHGAGSVAGSVVQGDITCATYFLKSHPRRDLTAPLFGGSDGDFKGQARVNEWIEYVTKCQGASSVTSNAAGVNELIQSIDRALEANSSMYLTGPKITLADMAAFGALHADNIKAHPSAVDASSFPAGVQRWFKLIDSNPATLRARHLLCAVDGTTEFPAKEVLDPLVSGCHMLEGAVPFEVTTRFPPEPSGYLHIGHAKAVLLNDYYARRYKGKLIVRFDDTNPSKEKEEFQQSIIEDLKLLGVFPDIVTYTSDYFEQLKVYALWLIDEGLAFMDDTPQEEMQKERLALQESKRRNLTPEENRKFFDLMASGDAEGAKWCLRAKIDMKSVNGTMRDPVIYRQNLTPHHRAGTSYKAYPTYDLACPIVDSVEGVTHALRTSEYLDRDEQYAWFQNVLKLRRVRIHSFARMNFMYTELSKRKLTWFVDNGHVTGWDDPRFPTVRGVVRRGVNVSALRDYILGQGASKRMTLMEWGKFWAVNKKSIDDNAKRFMAISKEGKVAIKVVNAADAGKNEFIKALNHPKFPELGQRLLKVSSSILVESSDMENVQVGEEIVLMRWGVVKITKVDGGFEGEFVPDGDFKDAKKRKITWLSASDQNIEVKLYEFDNLINKAKLEENENFKDFLNTNNLASTVVHGDPGMKSLKQDQVIQIERRGLFRVDKVYGRIGNAKRSAEGKEKLGGGDGGLVLFMIPDGKKRAISTLSTKLDHR